MNLVFFFSRELKKDAKKCADILVGKCKPSEYKMLPLYGAERKKNI